MAYVVTATWKATPDGVGVVREALTGLAPASRGEAACLTYIVYRDLAIESAIPNLASRERRFFETVDV